MRDDYTGYGEWRYAPLGTISEAGYPPHVHAFLKDKLWTNSVAVTGVRNREHEVLQM